MIGGHARASDPEFQEDRLSRRTARAAHPGLTQAGAGWRLVLTDTQGAEGAVGHIDDALDSFYFDETMAKPSNIVADPKADFATRLGIPVWLGCFLLVSLVAGALEANRVENHLAALGQSVEDLPKQMGAEFNGKLEKLRADLVEEIISKAQKFSATGNFKQAAGATNAAAILIALARDKKIPPPDPSFFANAVDSLNGLADSSRGPSILAEPVHRARVALAEYRSSLEQRPPHIGTPTTVVIPLNLASLMALHGSGAIWVGPPGLDMLKGAHSVSGVYLAEGWQTLDGTKWDDVLFMDMHIRYNGGPAILKNVIFVNCTFEVNVGPREAKLLDYATLGLHSIKLG